MERAAALEKENLGERQRDARGGRVESWYTVVATEKEKDQKSGETPNLSEKYISRLASAPLDPMSHRERLKKHSWAAFGSQKFDTKY